MDMPVIRDYCLRAVTRPVPHQRLIFLLALAAFCSPAWSQEKPKSEISKEEQSHIAAAKTPEEAVEMGKNFLATNHYAAAALSVQRACALQPDLLTDIKAQAPVEWNRFWFTE